MNLLIGLLAALWLALVLWLRAYRIWLPYYALAVGGSAAALAVVGSRYSGLDLVLAAQVARHVHGVGALVGLPTQTFAGAPGTLLVLVSDQRVGWTALSIGVESSGLLELGVVIAIVAWFPGWSLGKRLRLICIGVVATYLANLARVLLIALMLHHLGKGVLVLAHTYLGKALFFILIVAILWRVLTVASLRGLERDGRDAPA